MKVKAAVFREKNQPFSIETLELQPPHGGEVRVKIAAAGVCHSDWHLVTGATEHPTPVVPGHEGAGVVAAVGEGVTRVKPGDSVALSWAPQCGSCYYCLQGRPNLCSECCDLAWAGFMQDGTTRLSKGGQRVYHFSSVSCFAEYVVVPQQCCIRLDPKLSLNVAAVVGCAVTTGVGAVLNTAKVAPGSSVAVYGLGGVGLSIIMGARLAGASRIIAVDQFETKCRMAEEFGATATLIAASNTTEAVCDLTEGRGADYVFEAIGNPAGQEQCLHAARAGGMLILVGCAPMGSSTNLPGAIITRQEKTVTGSYYGSANVTRDIPLYVDLYSKGQLDLDRLISKTYALEQVNDAFDDMLRGEIARGLIVF